MKIKSMKLANAIKVESGDEVFYLDDRKYALELMSENVIQVQSTRAGSKGQKTYTSLFNCIYWVTDESIVASGGDEPKAKRAQAKPAAKQA